MPIPNAATASIWSLEFRRGSTRQRLASGMSHGGKPVEVGPIESLPVQRGDLVSLLIGPRDGNHSCDLTDVEFILISQAETLRNGISQRTFREHARPRIRMPIASATTACGISIPNR